MSLIPGKRLSQQQPPRAHAHLTGHLSLDKGNKLWDSHNQSDEKLLMLKEKYPV